jgi:prephenate dehydratase
LNNNIIAYQGAMGCFSYGAAMQKFPNATYKSCKTFEQVMKIVIKGYADIGVIPVDNSCVGRIAEVYNDLIDTNLFIVAESFLPVHHNLMMAMKAVKGLPPENLAEHEDLIKWKEALPTKEDIQKAIKKIKKIYTHSQGRMQCSNFLKENFDHIEVIDAWDTAGAARDLDKSLESVSAAIAPFDAAEIYNMMILAKNIENDADNTTRFLFLAVNPLPLKDISGTAVTTLVFQTKNKAGALLEALEVFKKYNVNLTKLETYMMGKKHSDPHFYVDCEFNPLSIPALIPELEKICLSVRNFGTYERA